MLGSHAGIHRFTVGQRKGLGLASPTGAPMLRARAAAGRSAGRGRPEVVARADAADRVRRELDRRGAWPGTLRVARADPASPSGGARHRAIARRRPRAEVVFDAPQLAIAPGQAVVFYDGDTRGRRRLDRLRQKQKPQRTRRTRSKTFFSAISSAAPRLNATTPSRDARECCRGSARRRSPPCSPSRRR